MQSYVIHFLRHGAIADTLKGKYIGKTDVPLSEEGAEAIARMWAHSARLYKSLGVKPWAYKLMNEPSVSPVLPLPMA